MQMDFNSIGILLFLVKHLYFIVRSFYYIFCIDFRMIIYVFFNVLCVHNLQQKNALTLTLKVVFAFWKKIETSWNSWEVKIENSQYFEINQEKKGKTVI